MTEVQVFEGDGKHLPPTTTKEAIEILRPLLEPYKDLDVKSAAVLRDQSSIRLSEAIQIVLRECEYQTNPRFVEELAKDMIFSGCDFHRYGIAQQVTLLIELVLQEMKPKREVPEPYSKKVLKPYQ